MSSFLLGKSFYDNLSAAVINLTATEDFPNKNKYILRGKTVPIEIVPTNNISEANFTPAMGVFEGYNNFPLPFRGLRLKPLLVFPRNVFIFIREVFIFTPVRFT
ncbi:MAG: hypothetical protein QNJ54_15420 [Prochloraceae cyanobacterium]|nr:hypothetical protein [Prochloraceae cyanobacterium]